MDDAQRVQHPVACRQLPLGPAVTNAGDVEPQPVGEGAGAVGKLHDVLPDLLLLCHMMLLFRERNRLPAHRQGADALTKMLTDSSAYPRWPEIRPP